MSDNQSLRTNFGAFEELSEQAEESISGGSASFSIYNATDRAIPYILDGNLFGLNPGQAGIFTTTGDGIILFDEDTRTGLQGKGYNLADGGRYTFQPNNRTGNNPFDLDLFQIA
jgi:hypothetical protein